MENYTKVKSVPVDRKEEKWDVFVGSGSKIKAVVTKCMKLLEAGDKVALTGFGPTVNKTITSAEIIKRNIQNLHQRNELFYKKMEDIWEPKEDKNLDRLTVTRNIPAIKIVLSKKALTNDEDRSHVSDPVDRSKKDQRPEHRGERSNVKYTKNEGDRKKCRRTNKNIDQRKKRLKPSTSSQ